MPTHNVNFQDDAVQQKNMPQVPAQHSQPRQFKPHVPVERPPLASSGNCAQICPRLSHEKFRTSEAGGGETIVDQIHRAQGRSCSIFLFEMPPPLPPDHPPSQSQTHADARDEGMRRALEVVMGRFPGDDSQKEIAWNKSLGLRFRQHLGWIACPCCRRGSPEVTTNIMDRWPWVNCVQQAGGWTRGFVATLPNPFPLSLASGSGSTHFKPFLFKSIMRSGFTFHSSFALRQNGCDRVRPDRPTQAASPGNFWLVWLFLCVCVGVSVGVCGVVCGVVCVCCVTVLPQDRPAGLPFRRTALSPDRPFAGPPFAGPPFRRLRRTALRRTAQNFALCFPSPASLHFRSFSLSGGLLVEFWWCF